jgi:hypothetical protein
VAGPSRILLANVERNGWFLCRGLRRGGVCPIDHRKARRWCVQFTNGKLW